MLRNLTIALLGGLAMLVCTVAMAQPVTPPASDQSGLKEEMSQLREENRQLREEVAALRGTLTDARSDFDQLRGQVQLLLKQLGELRSVLGATPGKGDTGKPTPKAEVPKDPMACPSSMIAAMREKYDADFDKPAPDSEVGRKKRQAEVQRWCHDLPKQLHGRGRWLVRLIDVAKDVSGKDTVKFEVLEPTTHVVLGEAFTMPLPARYSGLIKGLAARTLIEVGVSMEAEPVYNSARVERGVFDYPPMLGLYAEIGVNIEWQTVDPIKDSGKPDADRSVPR